MKKWLFYALIVIDVIVVYSIIERPDLLIGGLNK